MGHLASKGFYCSPNLSEALGVGVPDHRHHQAIRGLNSYADVDVVVLPNEVAMPRGVHSRHLLQSLQTHRIVSDGYEIVLNFISLRFISSLCVQNSHSACHAAMKQLRLSVYGS